MKNVHIHNLKNLVSTCSSKQTFKTPLLQVTALYIKIYK